MLSRYNRQQPLALLPASLRVLLAFLVAIAVFVWFAPGADASIYWSGVGIGRADLDGSNQLPGFIGASAGCGVATNEQHIYWSSPNFAPPGDFIGRASLPDGTGVDPTFISLSTHPYGLAVDGSHIYWTSHVAIGRANIDGSHVDEDFIPAPGGPAGVAVDGGHIYWTEGDGTSDGDPYTDHNRTVGRADLDGTNVDPDFIDPLTTFPSGVAVNATHIFWTAAAGFPGDRIARANLNGTGIEESFITGVGAANVEVDATHVYWTSGNGYYGSIGRSDLDGSNVTQNFIPGSVELFIACDVAVDSPSGPPPPPGPPTLTVIEHVVNDDGGPAFAGNWQMHIKSGSPLVDVAGKSPFAGAELPGTSRTLSAGSYNVSESGGPSGYSQAIGGDCAPNGDVSLAVGQNKTCTITNDDIAPTVVAPPAPTTGERASAISNCKKKHRKGSKKRRSCLKKAKKLPV